jgi:hypothetical protein
MTGNLLDGLQRYATLAHPLKTGVPQAVNTVEGDGFAVFGGGKAGTDQPAFNRFLDGSL